MRQPKRVYQGQPSTGGETLATVPGGKRWVITDIWLTAVTGNTGRTVSLSLVPDGNSAGAANRILHDVEVEPGSAVRISGGGLVAEAGDKLWGRQSNAGGITVTISGWEE